MKKTILLSILVVLICASIPMKAQALTYTQGYQAGKEAGYESGYSDGFDDGYTIRSFEAQNELTAELTKMVLLAVGVTAVVCLPISAAITALIVSRRRDREIRELHSQKSALSTELLLWQNRALYGIHAKGEFPQDN